VLVRDHGKVIYAPSDCQAYNFLFFSYTNLTFSQVHEFSKYINLALQSPKKEKLLCIKVMFYCILIKIFNLALKNYCSTSLDPNYIEILTKSTEYSSYYHGLNKDQRPQFKPRYNDFRRC